MSSILDAANVAVDKNGFLNDILPIKKGDVSIMTLEEAYTALGGSISEFKEMFDPTKGYDSSTYYMYAINVISGINDAASDIMGLARLKGIGVSWYQQLNKPNTADDRLTAGVDKLFGGPLNYVGHSDDNTYYFGWCCSDRIYSFSSDRYHWHSNVPGSVYVAVVRAK